MRVVGVGVVGAARLEVTGGVERSGVERSGRQEQRSLDTCSSPTDSRTGRILRVYLTTCCLVVLLSEMRWLSHRIDWVSTQQHNNTAI